MKLELVKRNHSTVTEEKYFYWVVVNEDTSHKFSKCFTDSVADFQKALDYFESCKAYHKKYGHLDPITPEIEVLESVTL